MFLWCFYVVGSKPQALEILPSSPPSSSPQGGSLILHFEDGAQHKIVLDSSKQACKVTSLPRKKIVRVEVAAADFTLYSRRNWSGTEKNVGAVGNKIYSADDVKFTKVKSVLIRSKGCVREANVPLVAISVCVMAVILVLAGVLLYRSRRTKCQHFILARSSEEQTQENGI